MRRQVNLCSRILSAWLAVLAAINVSAANTADTEGVNTVIAAYYDGMTRGDPGVLADVLHNQWHLKTLTGPEEPRLLVGTKREYIEMYTDVQQPDYADDRHITSIDFAYNSLAIVRIDSPTRRHSVFFTLVKTKGIWKITSKAFIAEEEALLYSQP